MGIVCGIARPASFRRTVESLGARVVRERIFPDHHAFTDRDVRDLDSDVALWLTTEKDATKILPTWVVERSIWVLPIDLAIEDEDAVFDALEAALQGAGRSSSSRSGGSTRPARSTS